MFWIKAGVIANIVYFAPGISRRAVPRWTIAGELEREPCE
jgi:hypothetical protein